MYKRYIISKYRSDWILGKTSYHPEWYVNEIVMKRLTELTRTYSKAIPAPADVVG